MDEVGRLKKQLEECQKRLKEKEKRLDHFMEIEARSVSLTEEGGLSLDAYGEMVSIFASAFEDYFKKTGAVNYVEICLDSQSNQEIGPLVLTLQRKHGLTPHEARKWEKEKNRMFLQAFLNRVKSLADDIEHGLKVEGDVS